METAHVVFPFPPVELPLRFNVTDGSGISVVKWARRPALHSSNCNFSSASCRAIILSADRFADLRAGKRLRLPFHLSSVDRLQNRSLPVFYFLIWPRNIRRVLGIISFLDFVVVHLVGRVTLQEARRILRVCTSNCNSNFHNVILRSKRYGDRVRKSLMMLSKLLVYDPKSALCRVTLSPS